MGNSVRFPDQSFAERLIGPYPYPYPVLVGENDDLDPGVQACLVEQVLKSSLIASAQPGVLVPQRDRAVLGTVPQPPDAPDVQAPPVSQQQQTPLEPDLCTRIFQVFTRAIETFFSWITSCFSYIFACTARGPGNTRTKESVVALPQPQAPQGLAPAQEQEQEAQVEAQNRIELGVNQGVICAKNMALGLRDHLVEGRAEDQIPAVIDAAIAAEEADIPRVENIQIQRLGETQNYTTEINKLQLHSVHAAMNAALLTKGEEVHLLFIDGRVRGTPQFYHFNPYAASLQRFDQIATFVTHLNTAIPIEVATPFTLQGLRIHPAQA